MARATPIPMLFLWVLTLIHKCMAFPAPKDAIDEVKNGPASPASRALEPRPALAASSNGSDDGNTVMNMKRFGRLLQEVRELDEVLEDKYRDDQTMTGLVQAPTDPF